MNPPLVLASGERPLWENSKVECDRPLLVGQRLREPRPRRDLMEVAAKRIVDSADALKPRSQDTCGAHH
jgi:hypothetical protein